MVETNKHITLSNRNFYFETSAVNYLVDRFGWNDALATKGLQNSKGNLWYLSPITLWEILLTSNKVRREKIIFFCQHLFHDQLINSPSEFIINYINAGCPLIENKYDFHSKLALNETWKNICDNKRLTFVYDYAALKGQMQQLQKFSKQLDKIINRVVLDITVSDDELSLQQFINYFYRQVKDELKYHDPDYHKVIKISILLIFYILCLEVDIDNTPIKKFWLSKGINHSIERLFYIMGNHKDLVFRGPFYQMAIMAFHQISLGHKSNRGLFMDCLHSIYITYSDIFITNDLHFKTLKEKKIHPNFSKLMHITEFELTTQLKEVSRPENKF